ncbi:hypothetical protein ACYZTM_06250 [Pseudomonas sp. MDT2-39-1]
MAMESRIVFERRAVTILYKAVCAHPIQGVFLLPANICPIVPMALYKAGRQFEFIDIAADTMCLDHEAVLRRWQHDKKRPAGLIYVRSYGAIFSTTDLFKDIKSISPGALIVDDRCLSPPSLNNRLSPNTDIELYSTGYAKYVDLGSGGVGILDRSLGYADIKSEFKQADLMRLIAAYKVALTTRTPFSYLDGDWLETNSPEVEWDVYKAKVDKEYSIATVLKSAINRIYTELIPSRVQFPSVFQDWRFNIYVRDKDRVLQAIRDQGFFASGHYESLAGPLGSGLAPNAEKLSRHVINLFNDRYFNIEQALKLARFLSDFKPLQAEFF